MSQLPIWAAWLQLIATGAIAGFAAFIAYKQWDVAKQRVVLDLFERRMTVYDEARRVIGSIVREGRADHTTFVQFVGATDRVEILFGEEVVNYIRKVRQNINEFVMHTGMLDAGELSNTERKEHAAAKGRLMSEFVKFYEEFPHLIKPYVRMTNKLSSSS